VKIQANASPGKAGLQELAAHHFDHRCEQRPQMPQKCGEDPLGLVPVDLALSVTEREKSKVELGLQR